jgi:hypothetical protein
MEAPNQPRNHSTSNTTFMGRARFMGYGCSFFCNRVTGDDVVEPRDTNPEAVDVTVPPVEMPEVSSARK